MRYHNISKDDMLNGEGLRAVLWVAGCEHGCKGCHNPITWDTQGGLVFDSSAKAELFALLEKDYISGVTLSGGDPMHPSNRNDIANLVKEIKETYPDKTIWMYTGYDWESIDVFSFLQYVDVLLDGQFVEELKDDKLHWVGSSNQRIIDVKQSLENDMVVLYE